MNLLLNLSKTFKYAASVTSNHKYSENTQS